jgi:hypothetical protein
MKDLNIIIEMKVIISLVRFKQLGRLSFFKISVASTKNRRKMKDMKFYERNSGITITEHNITENQVLC